MKISQLNEIRRLFEEGHNLMQYFRNRGNTDFNSSEAILISYDFQAGSYIRFTEQNIAFNAQYTAALANILNPLGGSSLLEVGVGEATTLANVVAKLSVKPSNIYGIDISWSRIKYAKKYFRSTNPDMDAFFCTGDLFQMPFADNSIDIVYTFHSIEPNGGREREALEELYRVTKKYLILLEPAYELASPESQSRMINQGYVTKLKSTAELLGYNIKEYRLFEYSSNPLNPTGFMLIEKSKENAGVENTLVCPLTKANLNFQEGAYYCKDSLLAYPILNDVPCLLKENAIVACHFDKF